MQWLIALQIYNSYDCNIIIIVKSTSLGTGSVYVKFAEYKLKVLDHCCACNCWLPNDISNTQLVVIFTVIWHIKIYVTSSKLLSTNCKLEKNFIQLPHHFTLIKATAEVIVIKVNLGGVSQKYIRSFWHINCKEIHKKVYNEKNLGIKPESLSNVHITIQQNIVLEW